MYFNTYVERINNCLLLSCLGKTFRVGAPCIICNMKQKIENSTDERRNNCLLLSCLGKTYRVGALCIICNMTQKIENSNDERIDYFNRAVIYISILIIILCLFLVFIETTTKTYTAYSFENCDDKKCDVNIDYEVQSLIHEK